MVVKYAGGISRPFTSISGVPQGSHLGPFLFNLYINDLVEEIEVKCLLFADDVKVYKEIFNVEDCAVLQRTLARIEGWCEINNMKMNASKCAVVTFYRISAPVIFNYTLCNLSLERKLSIKDLGVVFSANLNPDMHIDYICKKALRNMGLIVRASRLGFGIAALKILYISLVRSILEYGVVVWSPHQIGQIERLEKIQRRFLRIIGVKLGMEYAAVPVDRVAGYLAVSSLADRRVLADALFLRKILSDEINSPELLQLIDIRIPYKTRSREIFCHLQCSSNFEYYSPIPRMLRTGNHLAAEYDFFHDGESRMRKLLCSTSN